VKSEAIMKKITFGIALCLSSTLCLGQESDGYVIPFASTGNVIELAVENATTLQSTNVSVEATAVPSWIRFSKAKEVIAKLSGQSEQIASFTFSVEKTAPVGRTKKLTFVISTPNGQSWTKEISVKVGPPEKFELFQNYPNPFNPSTTISYQLTADSKVSLKIYNMIGQEVATLADGDKTVGFHQETWNASAVASGAYIYRLIAKDAAGKEIVEKKMMMVLK
jgi:hypothetical protein